MNIWECENTTVYPDVTHRKDTTCDVLAVDPQKGSETTHFSVNHNSQCAPFLTPLSIQSNERATQRHGTALSHVLLIVEGIAVDRASHSGLHGSEVTFCEPGLPPGGLAEHRGAAHAQHHRLRRAEHSGDFVATCKEIIQTLVSKPWKGTGLS